MVSPTTMAAVRASGAIPNAEYLLSAEGIRKEFPASSRSTTSSSS